MTIFDIAQFFLSKKNLTPKQLQKLCYYSQAWYYTLNEEPLFNEHFEAWVHGPVNPELYRRYKNYKWERIEKNVCPLIIQQDSYLCYFLDSIFEQYGKFSGNELETLTHDEDPWKRARGNSESWEPSYNLITLDSMKNYYSKYI